MQTRDQDNNTQLNQPLDHKSTCPNAADLDRLFDFLSEPNLLITKEVYKVVKREYHLNEFIAHYGELDGQSRKQRAAEFLDIILANRSSKIINYTICKRNEEFLKLALESQFSGIYTTVTPSGLSKLVVQLVNITYCLTNSRSSVSMRYLITLYEQIIKSKCSSVVRKKIYEAFKEYSKLKNLRVCTLKNWFHKVLEMLEQSISFPDERDHDAEESNEKPMKKKRKNNADQDESVGLKEPISSSEKDNMETASASLEVFFMPQVTSVEGHFDVAESLLVPSMNEEKQVDLTQLLELNRNLEICNKAFVDMQHILASNKDKLPGLSQAGSAINSAYGILRRGVFFPVHQLYSHVTASASSVAVPALVQDKKFSAGSSSNKGLFSKDPLAKLKFGDSARDEVSPRLLMGDNLGDQSPDANLTGVSKKSR